MSSSAAAAPILHLTSSIQIHAPLDAVWSALTDTTTWPDWNRFVPAVTIREQPSPSPTKPPAAAAPAAATLQTGTRMTFHVNMHPAAASTAPQSLRHVDNHVGLRVTESTPPATPPTRRARITWANDTTFQGRVLAALLSAERVHELVEREVVDGSSGCTRVVTEVTNWEVQAGYLAYVVKWMYGSRLEENFRCWVEDLKGFVEGQQQQTEMGGVVA
ncbi:hypothetical protein BP00DRAFT_338402 [Aspergillus indologenus CBS 114.80]|uniref:Coenzyme Q-binding protein COQ10 START domain-containing protein n=1 Tax=Aspergillus indologenus CBS 114.80 TaxID=1450541 RepID=A0A2V5IEU0_9EURO|nr:hypothetical protein BP00DRAFT_338402 [Aspergillus indologenus CBS 114.80]